ncbi:hypothetical protein A0J61_10982 [Choanephora cucurbitarum]|uniref:Uncharacterized protein n=1 Tax=Choanephora cucurbitarum TaxID=101091 RepID=A0A1C7MVW0_9FUNG|nr:hypothetical protein A0J61_10982 [Choanephora cucurbitarum]
MSLSVQDDYGSFHEVSSNYSFRDSYGSSRKIFSGEHETMLKHLYSQIEQLTLSNARLVRANRVLKLDCDRIVEERTAELQEALKTSVEQNIRLQRANRILQDEYAHQTDKLNHVQQDQIRQMKNVGPEYEYLVQVIHLLYRQLAGKAPCDCYPNEKQASVDNRHRCRPIIRSHVSGGNLAIALEQENHQLRDGIDRLMEDRDALYQLLKDKEEDNETLKHELKVKDDIVKQLENDFEKMELEVTDLQKVK